MKYEVVKIPYRRLWVVVRDDLIVDAYNRREFAERYAAYMNERLEEA